MGELGGQNADGYITRDIGAFGWRQRDPAGFRATKFPANAFEAPLEVGAVLRDGGVRIHLQISPPVIILDLHTLDIEAVKNQDWNAELQSLVGAQDVPRGIA